MLITFLLIYCTNSISFAFVVNELTPVELIKKSSEQYNIHQSISYSLDYKIKYLFNRDTIQRHLSCKMMKIKSDSIFNGIIWYNKDNVEEIYYTGKEIINILFDKKKILIDSDFQSRVNKNINLKKDYYHHYFPEIREFFLDENRLLSFIEEDISSIQINRVQTNSGYLWKLKIEYPNKEEYYNIVKVFYFQQNYLIKKIEDYVSYMGETQYREWNYSDIHFDSVDTILINKKLEKVFQNFKVRNIDLLDDNNQEDELLSPGITAPKFEGFNFQKNCKTTMEEMKNKLLLLDFWYIGCGACILSFPYLNSFYSKYSDLGLTVIGINYYDDYKTKKNILQKFIKTFQIEYPFIFTEKKLKELYNIKAYPSIFLINKNGKILFSDSGFSKEQMDTLELLIKKNIKY